jgi:hypothetical protein
MRSVHQSHFYFDGGIATGIKDLPTLDMFDQAHDVCSIGVRMVFDVQIGQNSVRYFASWLEGRQKTMFR